MTDLIQLPAAERVEAVISHAFGGLHHVRKFTEHKSKFPHWTCNVYSDVLCTVDWDNLTRLVVAAAEYGVRVEMACAGPHCIKLMMHPRYSRGGDVSERYPRLSDWTSRFAYADRLARANERKEKAP